MDRSADALFHETQLREWRTRLTAAVAGLFVFEAITGLVVYFGPFAVSTQLMVLLHTGVGLAFVVPYTVYQLRHWLANRQRPLNQHKLLGYLGFATVLVTGVSGLVLTVQAGWGTRISYAWDLVHLIGGLAATGFVVWHVAIILARNLRQAGGDKLRQMRAAQLTFLGRTSVLCVALLGAVVVWAWQAPFADPVRPFPADYQLPFGDNPFAPSLAMTAGGRALTPELLGGSETCGTGNCHADIVEEWLPSAHRYSSMSPFFQGVQGAMAANNGPESTRYCGGCHDPVALFSGSKNLYSDDLSAHGFQEGVSCVVCHSIETTDVRGNANYVIAPQTRYLYETAEGPVAAWLGRFLIRSYPRHHLESWTRDLYKTPEYCGACHKQFIDEEINNVGWVQLQNQYDNWRESRWNAGDDPAETITCRECHMRLVASSDPAAGDVDDYNRTADDGEHRSHRFIGANQYLPTLLDLPGAREHVRLTEEWLRGESPIPEIADKWVEGPAIPVQILAPAQAEAGQPVHIRVVTVNNKAGHDFPTGPLDIIQAWIEVEVRDDRGRLVHEAGTLDERGFLPPGTTVFKAEAIDQYGNLIDQHNLWEMVGARFKRTLFPGYSDVASYTFPCPGFAGAAPAPGVSAKTPVEGLESPGIPSVDVELATPAVGELVVTARLNYRKVDQYLIDFLFPDQGLTSRVTEMSVAEARIPVVAPAAPAGAADAGGDAPGDGAAPGRDRP